MTCSMSTDNMAIRLFPRRNGFTEYLPVVPLMVRIKHASDSTLVCISWGFAFCRRRCIYILNQHLNNSFNSRKILYSLVCANAHV